MATSFNVIIERDDDGYYVASVPSLKGCHTQATLLDQLMERTKEAIALCLDVSQWRNNWQRFAGTNTQRV